MGSKIQSRVPQHPALSYQNGHIYLTFKERTTSLKTSRRLTMTITTELAYRRLLHRKKQYGCTPRIKLIQDVSLGQQALQDRTYKRHPLDWFGGVKYTLLHGPQKISLRIHDSQNLMQAVSVSTLVLKLENMLAHLPGWLTGVREMWYLIDFTVLTTLCS